MKLPSLLHSYQQQAEQALQTILATTDNTPEKLLEAMRYSVLGHGKRLRPMLVYATAETFGASLCDAPACAVELIHCYSLVHDDLPAMDDDDLRRGKASCHIAYDEATAILVGDALQALAFKQLSSPIDDNHCKQQLMMITELAHASGAAGMAGGQVLDLTASPQSASIESIEHMHHLKTGALLVASVKLGALSANITDTQHLQTLDQLAQAIGLAFQIQDDILDVEASSDILGKPQGSDQQKEKATYTTIVGIDAAKQRVAQLFTQADELLLALDARKSALSTVITFLKNRSY